MTMTIREPERLALAIERIHDRWFDVDAITYDPGTRMVKIPFWNRPATNPPAYPATGQPQPFDNVLAIYDADPPRVKDKERIGTYTFNLIAYAHGQIVLTAEPNLRISCPVGSLHIEFAPDAIDQLVAKLARFTEANVIRTDNSISIRPHSEAGFTVELLVGTDGYTVFFDGGWHEEFASEEEAINCVGFGLSSSCRLAVTYRGRTPCRWAIQSRHGAEWKTDSVTGLLIFPFWRRPRLVFKQNDLLRL